MSKFNAGDKIRLLETPMGAMDIGDIVTVKRYVADDSFHIKEKVGDRDPYIFGDKFFELVEPATAARDEIVRIMLAVMGGDRVGYGDLSYSDLVSPDNSISRAAHHLNEALKSLYGGNEYTLESEDIEKVKQGKATAIQEQINELQAQLLEL
jgi:hypothetical protein